MIHRHDSGTVAVLSIDDGKANTLDSELMTELEAQLAAVEGSAATAVVLTGSRAIFSAGVDLHRVLDGGRAYLAEFLPLFSRSLRRLFLFPRPVVAALNGHAIAGGCVLAAACDRRLMVEGEGRIGLPELRVGVPFPTLALEVVRSALPERAVRDLVLSGRTIGPEEAIGCGVVEEVVAPGDLLPRAIARASDLGELPADAFALTKRQLRSPFLERTARLQELDAAALEQWQRPESAERIRLYVEATLGAKD